MINKKYLNQGPDRLDDIERAITFWEKVNWGDHNDCWNWLASTTTNGYGQFWNGNRNVPSHRFAYQLKHKVVLLSEEYVCHHCDNPLCCNPNHLFKGTHADNMRDMAIKNRIKMFS